MFHPRTSARFNRKSIASGQVLVTIILDIIIIINFIIMSILSAIILNSSDFLYEFLLTIMWLLHLALVRGHGSQRWHWRRILSQVIPFSQTIGFHIVLDYDAVKGLVLHDRTGERPEELDLKRGQYVFLTSRVCIIINIIIIIIIIIIIFSVVIVITTWFSSRWPQSGTTVAQVVADKAWYPPPSSRYFLNMLVAGYYFHTKGSKKYKK